MYNRNFKEIGVFRQVYIWIGGLKGGGFDKGIYRGFKII